MPRDEMPDYNPNRDAGEIPGFESGYWGPNQRGDTGKVLRNDDDPTVTSTHLHKHPDGITISTFRPDGVVERFNFDTGLREGDDPKKYDY